MTALRLECLAKSFAAPVLRDVSVDAAPGECVAIIGPSGAGKTTLLRLVAGLEVASGGAIYIGGAEVTRLAPEQRDVAMVFQAPALYPHLTAFENIAFPLRLRKTHAEEIQTRVMEAAQLLGVEGLLTKLPAQLSGGEAQRVALGRALVRRPAVLLMDEPLSSLPPDARLRLRHELLRLRHAQKTTTLYVTHDHEDALALGDRVAVLHEGRIQQIGAPREIYERPANRFVGGFVGRPSMNFLPDGANGRITLGVRPEHFEICDPSVATRKGMVESVQYLGGCVDLVMKLDGSEIVVRHAGPLAAGAGSILSLRVAPEHIHRFDSATGARL